MSDTQFAPQTEEPNSFNSNTSPNFSDDYNPLDEVVNEKPYSQPNFSANSDSLNTPIPEPTYAPPPIGKEDAYKEINKENSGKSVGGEEKATINPSLNEVPNEDKKMAAKHLTNLIIDGYVQANAFANYGVRFSESKINKMVSNGEINLDAPVTYDYGREISGREFVKSFNEQTKDTFTVSDEFKREVKPILQRVLEKKGAGLTDEQMLIYLFTKDVAIKGVQFYQIRKQMNDVLDTMKTYTEAYNQNNSPKSKQPSPEPTNNYRKEESYNNSYTETKTSSTFESEKEQEYSNIREEETYSSAYSEPEESTQAVSVVTKDSTDLTKIDGEAKNPKRKNHKVREGKFGFGNRGRKKKKDDGIADAEIIEENPLD